MKIYCSCGNIIPDGTDYLKHKGHLISDTQWFGFWDAIDNAIEKSGDSKKEKENACMFLRSNNPSKLIYECQDCGKLYVDKKEGEFISFIPENQKYNGVLSKND